MRALLLAAIVAVLAACGGMQHPLPDADPKEPTWFVACVHPTVPAGVYHLGNDANDCAHPDHAREIIWELPVHVQFEPGMAAPHEQAVLRALDTWNLWLGDEALYEMPRGSCCGDILVGVRDWPDGVDWSIAGVTTFSYDFDTERWFMDVLTYGKYALSHETLMHELGHALGLAHDPTDKRSLMYPSVNGDPSVLTPADCYAFAERYDLMPPECS